MQPETCRFPSGSRLDDPLSRARKARKILSVLEDYIGPSLSHLTCLDLGCFDGTISAALAAHMGRVLGLDVDRSALSAGQRARANDNLQFVAGTADHLPFEDDSFDLVICAQVYEHVPDQVAMADEIWRVLKDEGICFFSGPNKLDPLERHYGLPMLHWLPRRAADWCLRLSGRGDRYAEHPKTYWGLRALLSRFQIVDYTVSMLEEPERYSCTEEIPWASLTRKVPRRIWQALLWALPNYNWLLTKRDHGQQSP